MQFVTRGEDIFSRTKSITLAYASGNDKDLIFQLYGDRETERDKEGSIVLKESDAFLADRTAMCVF